MRFIGYFMVLYFKFNNELSFGRVIIWGRGGVELSFICFRNKFLVRVLRGVECICRGFCYFSDIFRFGVGGR